MYSTYYWGRTVVAERFIRITKNKIFKHMTAIQQNIFWDVLDDIVDKYNNTVHRTIKTKPVEVTDDYYAEYNGITFNEDLSTELDWNKKNSKFKIGDNVRISKYKNIFTKGYTPNWSEKVFVINKIKNTVPWTMLLVIWIVKKLLKVVMKKNCLKLVKKNLE